MVYMVTRHFICGRWNTLRNVAPFYDEFINNCDWNSRGCINLTAFPQEWPNLYFIGNLGLLFSLNTYDTINTWYIGSLVLNGLAAAFFLSQFIKSPVFYFGLAPFVALQSSITARLAGHFSLVAAWPMFSFWVFLSRPYDHRSAILPNQPGQTLWGLRQRPSASRRHPSIILSFRWSLHCCQCAFL